MVSMAKMGVRRTKADGRGMMDGSRNSLVDEIQ